MDKEKLMDAIWDLYMTEARLRHSGYPIEADRIMNIRIKIKEATGLDQEMNNE